MKTKTLSEVLQSTSEILFPDSLGRRVVHIDSRDSDGDTPLHKIVRGNDAEATRLLIEAGADVNAIGDMGETPLHAAASQRNQEIFRMLLSAGANPHIRSELGYTPAERAKQWEYVNREAQRAPNQATADGSVCHGLCAQPRLPPAAKPYVGLGNWDMMKTEVGKRNSQDPVISEIAEYLH
jgi:ankyrin repeat protein